MNSIGWLKSSTFLWILNYVGIPATLVYFISMCIAPWLDGGWDHVHQVWLDWQTLNTGVIAFISSIIAFNISNYTAEKQREREFVAARALLPQNLDDLLNYIEKSKNLIFRAEYCKATNTAFVGITPPKIDTNILTTIQSCIRHATPEVANYLANILNLLQIHGSRLDLLCARKKMPSQFFNMLYYEMAILRINVDKLFPLARGEESELRSPSINKELIDLSYHILNIFYDSHEGLEKYTVNKLQNQNRR